MYNYPGSFDPSDLAFPLPGREREQLELSALLDRAFQGYGGVVLISGEAGIGKTTLCDRLLAHAHSASAHTLSGHCYSSTAGQPFAPWDEIRRSLEAEPHGFSLPRLTQATESGAGPASKIEQFEQLTDVLREVVSSAPLIIVLEDIHWADSASLELLRHISRQTANLSLLLVATYRDSEPESGSNLRTLLPDIIREARAHRLELHRLSLDEIQDFVDRSCRQGPAVNSSIAHYLHQRSEGNPFFMTELLRDVQPERLASSEQAENDAKDLADLPVPGLVRQVIDNRVSQLSEPSRSLLNVAAVIGQEVPVDLWQEVTESSDQEILDCVEESIASHLLGETSDGTRVRFVHGLIQETLYQQQLSLRRRTLHRRIAGILSGGQPAEPGAVAHHYDRAGDTRATEWLIAAARQAQEIYAAQDAIRYINRAIEVAGGLSTTVPAEAYLIRARAREMLGELDLARADYERYLSLAQEAGDKQAECQTLIDLGLLWSGLDYQRAGEFLERALHQARVLGDDSLHARCLNRLGNWRANTGEFDSAIEVHRQALAMYESIGERDGVADTLDLLGSTNFLAGNYRASVSYFDRAIEQSRALNDRPRLSSSLANLAIIGGDFDTSFDAGVAASRSPEEWLGYGEEAVTIAREVGWRPGESFAKAMLGSIVAVRGDLGRGLALVEDAHEIARRLDHHQWVTGTSLILSSIWLELLEPTRAIFFLERGRAVATGLGSQLWSMLLDAALAAINAEQDNTDAAFALLDRWENLGDPVRSHAQRGRRFSSCRTYLAAGQPDVALRIAEDLLALEEEPSGIGGVPQILKLKADALTALDRLDEAETAYQSACHASDLLGYTLVKWRVLRDWSVLCFREQRLDEASELVAEADSIVHAIAGSIGDPAIRERFRSRASESIRAVGRGSPAPVNLAGLSRREIEVLTLVARGLTDAQVAERLFISPRTVARHLQSIYGKLDVNSRTGATAFAFQHKLIT